MDTLRLFAAMLAALALPPLHAHEVSLEAVAQRYLAARTYCETGKWFYPLTGEVNFSLCAADDDRFLFVQHAGEPSEEVFWASREHVHWYRKDTRSYEERPRHAAQMEGFTPGRAPAATSRLLRESWGRGGGVDGAAPLGGFAPSPEFSTTTHAVFTRFDFQQGFMEHLSVRRSDGAMVRYEQRSGTALRHYVELSSVRLDPVLAREELVFQPPVLQRFSPRNNPALSFAVLLAGAAAAAAVAWGWVFTRTADSARVLHVRSMLWRYWRRALALVAAGTGVLTLMALANPGSGQPPGSGMVLPRLLGLWGGGAFAVAGCMLLASYPVQRFLSGRRRGRSPSAGA